MQQIGIFGGSFNPIHCGHIAMAQEILRLTSLDEVWLMVSPQNPLKQQKDLLDERERLQLARKALQGVSGIRASDFEFSLPRPSYTWATLEALREAFPHCQFSLIIGGDNWDHFDRWYRADDIRAHYPLIVYPRGGFTPTSPSQQLFAQSRLYNVSSTEVRRRARQGLSLEGQVPPAIIDDVKRLYG